MECLCRKFHLSHVEITDSSDFVPWVNFGGRLSLRPIQDNIHEILSTGNRHDTFEVINWHFFSNTRTIKQENPANNLVAMLEAAND